MSEWKLIAFILFGIFLTVWGWNAHNWLIMPGFVITFVAGAMVGIKTDKKHD